MSQAASNINTTKLITSVIHCIVMKLRPKLSRLAFPDTLGTKIVASTPNTAAIAENTPNTKNGTPCVDCVLIVSPHFFGAHRKERKEFQTLEVR